MSVKKLSSTQKSLKTCHRILKQPMKKYNTSLQYKIGWAYWHCGKTRSCWSPVICVLALSKKNSHFVSSILYQLWRIFSNFMFFCKKQTNRTPKTVIRKFWYSLHKLKNANIWQNVLFLYFDEDDLQLIMILCFQVWFW